MKLSSKGFTLLETLLGLAILTVVTSAIYFSYANVLEIIQAAQYNSAALSIIETEVETVRNMRYEDVGTIGGIPSGILTASRSVEFGGAQYHVNTFVRTIDDPADGTLAGIPEDVAPADYKLVQFEVICDTCTQYRVISMASYVAPKNLESSSQNGALFVQVFDAAGIPISGATVHITNTLVSPAVNITDTTDTGGLLQLYDVATSSAGYHIVVSKSGYSSDQTYSTSQVTNPLNPDTTVAHQQLSVASFAIDRIGNLSFVAHDNVCAAIPNFDVRLQGAKLIGTAPDTPKYLQNHTTNASGTVSLPSVEWDSYTATPIDAQYVLAGRFTPAQIELAPAQSGTIEWLIASSSASAISFAVVASGDVPIADALVTISKSGFSSSGYTGQTSLQQTDWSEGQYTAKDASVDADAESGLLTLVSTDGTYASGSDFSLTTTTLDLGTASTSLTRVQWAPTDQPSDTSIKLQIAANNDNATWTFIGPDGTGNSFFTDPNGGQAMPAAALGKRYVRIKIVLRTDDASETPSLEEFALWFRTGCVPSGTAFFSGLEAGAYVVDVTRPGYLSATASVSIASQWQEASMTLQPQ